MRYSAITYYRAIVSLCPFDLLPETVIIPTDFHLSYLCRQEAVMLEIVEKTLLTGIGAVVLTQKKAEELIDDLKKRLNLTEEEGKNLLEKLREAAKDNQKKLEEMAQDEVTKACERIGVVTKEEFKKLQNKVDKLEKQFKDQEK